MNIKIEELRKHGLTNLAELLEAKDKETEDDAELPSLDKDDAEGDDTEDKGDDTKAKKENPFAKVKESMDTVEGITEEFKVAAEEAFVTAVTEQVNEKYQALEDKVTKYLDEQAEEQEKSIDSYLTYIGEQWLEENKEAVESKLQTKLTESFMVGLRDLFEQHNIVVPENKVDLVEELQAELVDTQDTLKIVIAKLQEAQEALATNEKIAIVDEACQGLSETEVDKFHQLAKEFLNEDVVTFQEKVIALKEYSSGSPAVVTESEVEDEVPAVVESTVVDVPMTEEVGASVSKPDDKMKSYIAALRKGNRK